MSVEEEVAQLREENQVLRVALHQARDQLSQVQGQLQVALERIEQLEQLKTAPPSFVKANAKKPKLDEKKPRKKREAKYNRARQRAEPTQIVEHWLVFCPDCHLRLGGISLARLREVIDIAPPPRVEVTQHRIYKGWCAGCQKWHEAPAEVQEEVLGQGRIGVRLAS